MDGKGPRAGCGSAWSEPAGRVVARQVAAPGNAVALKQRHLAHAAQLYDGGRNPGATSGRGEDDLSRERMMLGFQDDADARVGGEVPPGGGRRAGRRGGGDGSNRPDARILPAGCAFGKCGFFHDLSCRKPDRCRGNFFPFRTAGVLRGSPPHRHPERGAAPHPAHANEGGRGTFLGTTIPWCEVGRTHSTLRPAGSLSCACLWIPARSTCTSSTPTLHALARTRKPFPIERLGTHGSALAEGSPAAAGTFSSALPAPVRVRRSPRSPLPRAAARAR
jgi:hypothetical protein